jgi:hypothetical protein
MVAADERLLSPVGCGRARPAEVVSGPGPVAGARPGIRPRTGTPTATISSPAKEAPVSPGTLLPLGPANGEVDFFVRGACAQPGVDPALFTSEEDDDQAVAAARAVCARCPVRLPCRRYADVVNSYGVYAGETQTERAAMLQVRAHHATGEQRQPGEPLA